MTDSVRGIVTIRCRGHAQITAGHSKTFELTPDADIGPRATCVIGVGAQVDGDPRLLAGPVEIALEAGGIRQRVTAEANPFATHGFVVRKSDFRGHDTLAVNADAAASDLDRELVAALQHGAELTVRITATGNAPTIAVFTDDAAPDATDADEVVAATPLAQLRACAALVAPGRPTLLVDALPKQATERRAYLAAALATAHVVAWRGPAKQAQPLLDLDGAVAAVDRGEAVTRIGHLPARIPADATVTVAAPGAPAHDDLGPVLKALREEGVTARTIRQALARLPHLAGRWDYDAINRL